MCRHMTGNEEFCIGTLFKELWMSFFVIFKITLIFYINVSHFMCFKAELNAGKTPPISGLSNSF